MTFTTIGQAGQDVAIRPFQVGFPQNTCPVPGSTTEPRSPATLGNSVITSW